MERRKLVIVAAAAAAAALGVVAAVPMADSPEAAGSGPGESADTVHATEGAEVSVTEPERETVATPTPESLTARDWIPEDAWPPEVLTADQKASLLFQQDRGARSWSEQLREHQASMDPTNLDDVAKEARFKANLACSQAMIRAIETDNFFLKDGTPPVSTVLPKVKRARTTMSSSSAVIDGTRTKLICVLWDDLNPELAEARWQDKLAKWQASKAKADAFNALPFDERKRLIENDLAVRAEREVLSAKLRNKELTQREWWKQSNALNSRNLGLRAGYRSRDGSFLANVPAPPKH